MGGEHLYQIIATMNYSLLRGNVMIHFNTNEFYGLQVYVKGGHTEIAQL